jgi:hypothetical protein
MMGPMEISVSPPETLVKYNAPLFGGTEPSADKGKSQNQAGEAGGKLEDMINSMLPPRYRSITYYCLLFSPD